MIDIDVPGRELVLTFRREDRIEDRFICTDGITALKLALVMLVTRHELGAGDVLSVEWRRRPSLIERGLG